MKEVNQNLWETLLVLNESPKQFYEMEELFQRLKSVWIKKPENITELRTQMNGCFNRWATEKYMERRAYDQQRKGQACFRISELGKKLLMDVDRKSLKFA